MDREEAAAPRRQSVRGGSICRVLRSRRRYEHCDLAVPRLASTELLAHQVFQMIVGTAAARSFPLDLWLLLPGCSRKYPRLKIYETTCKIALVHAERSCAIRKLGKR